MVNEVSHTNHLHISHLEHIQKKLYIHNSRHCEKHVSYVELHRPFKPNKFKIKLNSGSDETVIPLINAMKIRISIVVAINFV